MLLYYWWSCKLNETSIEAVVRETFEETGFNFEINKLVFIQERFLKYNGKNHHEIVFFYLMKYNNINIIDGTYTDQGEKETLHWLSIDELKQINIVPDFLKNNLSNISENIIHIISRE